MLARFELRCVYLVCLLDVQLLNEALLDCLWYIVRPLLLVDLEEMNDLCLILRGKTRALSEDLLYYVDLKQVAMKRAQEDRLCLVYQLSPARDLILALSQLQQDLSVHVFVSALTKEQVEVRLSWNLQLISLGLEVFKLNFEVVSVSIDLIVLQQEGLVLRHSFEIHGGRPILRLSFNLLKLRKLIDEILNICLVRIASSRGHRSH